VFVNGRSCRRFAELRSRRGRGRAELEFKLVRIESTRCRDTEDKRGASVVATRARWRVESNSSNWFPCELDEGAGEGGKKAVFEVMREVSTGHDGAVIDEGMGTAKGRPEAARALITASQPRSRVLMRSRSSSFSFSLAASKDGCECSEAAGRPRPARNCLFSSSSSATRRSRLEKWAFLLSREFWAAMRLRCARASLRSSGVMSERERLRGGQSEEEEAAGEDADSGVPGSCWTRNAASADRFTVVMARETMLRVRGKRVKNELVLYGRRSELRSYVEAGGGE
jgi:hypothetical protein